MKITEINYNELRWINITGPDQEMVDYLRENFHFHVLDLEDVLSKAQYPKIDAYQDYLFIILQFPLYESHKRIYKRTELDIFFGKDYIITINSGELNPLQNFFETCRADDSAREKFIGRGGAMLLYEILDSLLDYVFPIINQKNELIFQLEEEIFETPETKDMIQEIMILKRNIINVRRILLPQRFVFADLQTKYKRFVPEELNIYFDDIIDKKDKIINQLDTALAYIDVLEDANEALISRSSNKVLKVLAIFSVIPLPLTILLNYYGMNVNLPYQNNPHILAYINLGLVIMTFTMIAILIRKKWL
ncbi:MAG: magnesium transporter CorA family protein [Candidatus Doudnabacteria bacterium]|nr:magnesium transporter CorA family protein [bacterium]MDZ4243635.1 magnesium transporter CorA family protein [Candidatus Doudnabacteria bacterium]